MTAAIAMSSLIRELSDIKDLFSMNYELTETNLEGGNIDAWIRHLERKHLECEHVNPWDTITWSMNIR